MREKEEWRTWYKRRSGFSYLPWCIYLKYCNVPWRVSLLGFQFCHRWIRTQKTLKYILVFFPNTVAMQFKTTFHKVISLHGPRLPPVEYMKPQWHRRMDWNPNTKMGEGKDWCWRVVLRGFSFVKELIFQHTGWLPCLFSLGLPNKWVFANRNYWMNCINLFLKPGNLLSSNCSGNEYLGSVPPLVV